MPAAVQPSPQYLGSDRRASCFDRSKKLNPVHSSATVLWPVWFTGRLTRRELAGNSRGRPGVRRAADPARIPGRSASGMIS